MRAFWICGLLAFWGVCPVQAQDVSHDQIAIEIAERLDRAPFSTTDPQWRADFMNRYGFGLSVPVALDDLTRVRVAEVRCIVYSSHLDRPSMPIGSGSTLIVEDDGLHPVDSLQGYGMAIDYRYSNWRADRLDGFEGTVSVPVLANPGLEVDGWTHGECALFLHYDDADTEPLQSGVPSECPEGFVDFALCVGPGASELDALQSFGRVGYDAAGSPLGRPK